MVLFKIEKIKSLLSYGTWTKIVLKVIIVLMTLGSIATLVGSIMSHVEQPSYTVLKSEGNITVRQYGPLILAEVEISGPRKEAISEGFKILADYIFGNNTLQEKMESTGPFTNQLSKKIAMTAPVTQERSMDGWKVRFVMPNKYTIQTLPRPNSNKIHLISVPSKQYAAIAFSGLATDSSIQEHTEELAAYLVRQKLTSTGGVILAFYNPPWTLPLLRRNEILIEIKE